MLGEVNPMLHACYTVSFSVVLFTSTVTIVNMYSDEDLFSLFFNSWTDFHLHDYLTC